MPQFVDDATGDDSLQHDFVYNPLRVKDLTTNSSSYERFVAAPDDDTRYVMWTLLSTVSAISGFFTLFVFLAILSSKTTRSQPFNWYLLFLMVPDFLFSLLCMVTCAMNARHLRYYSDWMCKFQQFYVTFGVMGNSYVNLLIAYQIHKMLSFTARRKRYQPPIIRTVKAHCLLVYVFVGLWAMMGIFGTPWDPFYTAPSFGFACLRVQYDDQQRASPYIFWLLYLPVYIGIPLGIILYAAIDIWWRSLFPPMGKRRLLTIYFGRLVLVFFIMWVPVFIIHFILGQDTIRPWVEWFGTFWGHLQGCVSTGVSVMKPDIKLAVSEFFCCSGTRLSSLRNSLFTNRSSCFMGFSSFWGKQSMDIISQPQQPEARSKDPVETESMGEDSEQGDKTLPNKEEKSIEITFDSNVSIQIIHPTLDGV